MINIREKKKKGFSLVELIVVIAIMGVLAAIAVPKYSQYRDNANKRADQLTAKLLGDATLMAIENGELTAPVAIKEGLAADNDKWNAVKAYVTDTEIKLTPANKWRIYTGVSGSNKYIRVFSAASTTDADNAGYTNTNVKVKLELGY